MIRDLFFNIAPAISTLFKLGFEPKEECFYELTIDQYEQLRKDGEDITETLYMILPEESKYMDNDIIVVNEQEKNSLLKAKKVIENYCEKGGKVFNSYQDKLTYVSNLLPSVFTEDSNFRKCHLKLVEPNQSK
uniref:Uncharacterized protein n=1 Tax=Chlorobium chlorochromatii (strain CaD3) TaxID=340177 RepID=Q3ASL8_CHLCH